MAPRVPGAPRAAVPRVCCVQATLRSQGEFGSSGSPGGVPSNRANPLIPQPCACPASSGRRERLGRADRGAGRKPPLSGKGGKKLAWAFRRSQQCGASETLWSACRPPPYPSSSGAPGSAHASPARAVVWRGKAASRPRRPGARPDLEVAAARAKGNASSHRAWSSARTGENGVCAEPPGPGPPLTPPLPPQPRGRSKPSWCPSAWPSCW